MIAQSPGLPPEAALARIAGLAPSTRASYLERRTQATASCRGLSVRVPVIYTSWQDVERLIERDGGILGPAFTARHPGAAALTSVSRAGLSADGRQALVLVERAADGRWRMRHAELLMVAHAWRSARVAP